MGSTCTEPRSTCAVYNGKALSGYQNLAAGMLTEMWLRSRERIYLSKRKGFVKVAIQAGADIVPVYVLGQSQVNYLV